MRQREILNAAKEQAGMTQKEFAKYFGIPLRTVEGWYTEKQGDSRLFASFDVISVRSRA